MSESASTEGSETHSHLVTSQCSSLIRGQESQLYIQEKSQSTDFAEHGTITDPIGAYQ